MAVIDACARLLPGVLGNEASTVDESHSVPAGGLLEYPHYTRPPEFQGARVPEVLVGGNHAEIARWRREQAAERTRARRPDLWARFERAQDVTRATQAVPAAQATHETGPPQALAKRARRGEPGGAKT